MPNNDTIIAALTAHLLTSETHRQARIREQVTFGYEDKARLQQIMVTTGELAERAIFWLYKAYRQLDLDGKSSIDPEVREILRTVLDAEERRRDP